MNKRLSIKAVFAAFCTVCWMASAASSSADQAFRAELDNGMVVLITEKPDSPVVAVYGLVKTGSATEGEFIGTGISHYLEHMLFKGTKTRGLGQIAAEVQAVGGSMNASTGRDYTIYTVDVPHDRFSIGLDIIADVLQNATLDPEEAAKEGEVILSEMQLHNDNPDRRLLRAASENVYHLHPYRHPVIGYESLFKAITPAELMKYYKTHYVPNNIILTIAGNVKAEEVMPAIKEAFKDFKRSSYPPRNLPPEPEQIGTRWVEESYPTQITRLSMAYASVRLLDRDLFALDVLASILGQGSSSRLYADLYDNKKIVYNLYAGNYTPIDRGSFSINAQLDYENLTAVVDAIKQHIAKIGRSGVTAEELSKAKRQVLSDYIAEKKTASGVAYSQGIDEAFAGDHQFSQKYVEAIRKVTNEEIIRVTKQYLIDDALCVTVLKPQDEFVLSEKQAEKITDSRTHRHQMDNGAVILLKEDHSLPLISMYIAFGGGLRQEPPELNGVTQLMATTWVRGTKSMTWEKISRFKDRYAIRLSPFSGSNSYGLHLEFLSEDFERALGLAEDIIKHPVFPEEELEKMRTLMRTNLKWREDNIYQKTNFEVKQALFLEHPVRMDVNGTEETIGRITRADVLRTYHRFTAPNNMVLTVFGDIDPEEMLDLIRNKFGRLKKKDIALQKFTESPITSAREKEVRMDKEQALVIYAFHGTRIYDQERYGLEVLAAILGSSFNGRMFMNIRDKLGQAYSLSGYSAPNIDSGIIQFYVLTAPEKAAEVKKLLRAEIERIQKEEVTAEELNEIKTYLKGNNKADLETITARAQTSTFDELYGLGHDYHKKYDDFIDQVGAGDIKVLAGKYLDLNKAVIVTTLPKEEGP